MRSRMTVYRRTTAMVLLLIVGTGLMATGEVRAQETVSYRLKWLINASTAGDVFAQSQGFFSREGMEVRSRPEVRNGMPSGNWSWGMPSSA
jgi:NitT/TauT family transport system substrate-binding protein